MTVFTADTVGGDVWMVCGWPGLDREGFVTAVKLRLHNTRTDEGAPLPDLDLHEWENEELAGAWLAGNLPVEGQSWTTMGKTAQFGRIVWTVDGMEYRPVIHGL